MTAVMPPLDSVTCADALDFLRTLPDESVHCIVTSPPYFGLRDYGVDGQIGLESTPRDFVDVLVAVFREARRVLRSDGTCWINLGDSFSGSGKGGNPDDSSFRKQATNFGSLMKIGDTARQAAVTNITRNVEGVAPKNLLGIPWRVAFALQDDGWTLRSDIIWSKSNPMPESVTDRPTKAHEYVFLLSKSEHYWYDAEAIKEPLAEASFGRAERKQRLIDRTGAGTLGKQIENGVDQLHGYAGLALARNGKTGYDLEGGRNKRSVWTIATEPTPDAHFATFPKKLIEPMILAGCPATVCAECGAPWERVTERETSYDHVTTANGKSKDGPYAAQTGDGKGTHDIRHGVYSNVTTLGFRPICTCDAATDVGIVLDPFGGSGTTGLVARQLGRHYLLCDLNPAYVAMATDRLRLPFEPRQVKHDNDVSELPLFSQASQP